MSGWGAFDAFDAFDGERLTQQAQFLRQTSLILNKTTDCTCEDFYFLETNVGADKQDPCKGDSGKAIESLNVMPSLSAKPDIDRSETFSKTRLFHRDPAGPGFFRDTA